MLSKIGCNSNPNFGRALSTNERKEHDEVWQKAFKLLQKDKTILIAPGFCMPQKPENNTGVGHFASEESGHALDILKSYTGANVVEDLPIGQSYIYKNYHAVYAATAFSLGTGQINLKALTTPEYGNILAQEDFDTVVKSNTTDFLQSHISKNATKETFINFENIIEKDSPQNQALQKAFDRFKQSTDTQVQELKGQFELYKKENHDWLEPKGIYDVLEQKHQNPIFEYWQDETDKNLYNPDFDQEKRCIRKEEILKNHTDEIEFFKFRQFIAEKHHQDSKKQLNQKGLKYYADQQIAFSKDEIWAHPKAFLPNTDVGWGIRALNFDDFSETSESGKLLARKTELSAKRFDGIRFDVGWSFINQRRILHGTNKVDTPKYMDRKVIDLIEKTVKKVKGPDFDTKNLIYEVEADFADLAFLDKQNKLIPPMQKIVKIYTSAHMGPDWGSNEAYLHRGFGADYFVVGPGNHDPMSLREIAETDSRDLGKLGHVKEMRDLHNKKQKTAEDTKKLAELRKKHNLVDDKKFNAALYNLDLKETKEIQSTTLAKIFGFSNETLRNNPIEFIKAKFAEPVGARNNMIFFMDFMGRKERYNDQTGTATNFRYRLSDSFEKEYHQAVQNGHGFNLMDSLEKVFKARKLDKKHPELYQNIVKFKDTLYEKGVTTEKEANESISDKTIKTSDASSLTKNRNFKFWAIGTAIVALGASIWAYKQNSKKETT